MQNDKKTILITGDDGYNSIGIRLLIHYLKDDYQVFVGGTKTQQTAMGGRLNLTGGDWGEDILDGVPVIWVDGSPSDAVGAAFAHFGHKFDYVVSGINLGANIGGANISSGTFSAAFRALNSGITTKGIAISWDITPEFWLKDHTEDENLDEYLKHPGENAKQAIKETLDNNLWGVNMININIPTKKGSVISFTQPMANVTEYFAPLRLDQAPQTFIYPMEILKVVNTVPGTDLHALQNGEVSISLCRTDFMDLKAYTKMKDTQIKLK